MQGDTPYFAKIIHVFFNMDSMSAKTSKPVLPTLKPPPKSKPPRTV